MTGDDGMSYVTVDGLKLFSQLQDLLTAHQKSCESLVNDPQVIEYYSILDLYTSITTNEYLAG